MLSAPANEVIERDAHGVAFLTQYDGGVNARVAQLRQYIVGEELVAFLAHIGLDTAYKVRTTGGDFCHQFGQRILLEKKTKACKVMKMSLNYCYHALIRYMYIKNSALQQNRQHTYEYTYTYVL